MLWFWLLQRTGHQRSHLFRRQSQHGKIAAMMRRFAFVAVFPALATVTLLARADGQEIRRCDFEVKARCASGDARVTLADGAVIRVEMDAYWCALHGRPPFICTIDSSRSDHSSVWSEDGGSTLIDNSSPWNPEQPDRVKVTVERDVTIDLNETQSLGRCGAGAELPRAIIIPAHSAACRVWLRTP